MKTVTSLLLSVLLIFGPSFSTIADDTVAQFDCVEPSLNVDFDDASQLRMLERDFIAYEDCYIAYATTLQNLVAVHNEMLSRENPEENWANESEEVVLARLQNSLQVLTEGKESLDRASDSLRDLIARILEHVPADEFNEWDAQSKFVEN